MRIRTIAAAALVAALAVPAVAAAKGPASASISGPGLKGSVPIKGQGEGGPSSPLGDLVIGGGYFAAVFGQQPDPMSKYQPKAVLGTRYTVTYRMPGPNGSTSTIRQDVYPYARPYPLTYMKPGQEFWNGEHTYGGWFIAGRQVKDALVQAGLPRTAPTAGNDGFWWSAGAIAIVVAAPGAALALLGGLLARRRRTTD